MAGNREHSLPRRILLRGHGGNELIMGWEDSWRYSGTARGCAFTATYRATPFTGSIDTQVGMMYMAAQKCMSAN